MLSPINANAINQLNPNMDERMGLSLNELAMNEDAKNSLAITDY